MARLKMRIQNRIKKTLFKMGFDVRKVSRVGGIPDAQFYTPFFSPWLGYGRFKDLYDKTEEHTLVSADRCYVLYALASQALFLRGDIWECGVYKGGTAILLAELIASTPGVSPKLHLFDTFQGMPETDPQRDRHRPGDFSDISLATVRERVGREDIARFHPGLIPDTFQGLEQEQIAFAHVDVDIYQSVLDCCDFIVPRMVAGGFIVFDDYGFPSCPGARQAVDDFFRERRERPLTLSTGQAVVFMSFGEF
jgi:O-methyltransferase